MVGLPVITTLALLVVSVPLITSNISSGTSAASSMRNMRFLAWNPCSAPGWSRRAVRATAYCFLPHPSMVTLSLVIIVASAISLGIFMRHESTSAHNTSFNWWLDGAVHGISTSNLVHRNHSKAQAKQLVLPTPCPLFTATCALSLAIALSSCSCWAVGVAPNISRTKSTGSLR